MGFWGMERSACHATQEFSGKNGKSEIVHLFGVSCGGGSTAIEGKIADPRKYL